jgi:hypothetical protein
VRRVLKMTAAAAALATVFAGTATHAAKMKVDHDCNVEKNCSYVHISGEIVEGDADRFKDMIKKEKVERAMVIVDGPGGTIYDGLTIGAMVHELGYLTFVGADVDCVSVCASIWLAGKVRYASDHAAIGSHAASVRNVKTYKIVGPSKTGDKAFTAYYERLGMTGRAIRYLLAAKGDDVTYLKVEEAYDLGIIVRIIPAEKKEDEKPSAPDASTETKQKTADKPVAQCIYEKNGRCQQYKFND